MISAFGVDHGTIIKRAAKAPDPGKVVGPFVREHTDRKGKKRRIFSLGHGTPHGEPERPGRALPSRRSSGDFRIAKGRTAGGLKNRPRVASMEHRGGEGYFHPSPKQLTASRARRVSQAADRAQRIANKPNVRVGVGRKLHWTVHRKAAGRLPEVTAGVLAAGAGAGYLLHRRTEVDKALTQEQKNKSTNVGLGAAAGTAGGFTAMGVGGHATKIALKERRAKRGESPTERKIWSEHKAKYAQHGPKSWKPYAAYPKSLPDWKIHRALAFKNRAPVSAGIVLSGTAAGAAYGLHRHNQKVRNG